jgi:hypothetical protein
MLSDKQALFYQTFGFLALRQLLTSDEVRAVNDELLRRLETVYPGRPYDGTMRYGAPMMGPDTPFYASLPEDSRFLGAARQLYGDDVLIAGNGGNRYAANSLWHPDVGPDHPGGPKFAIYLEPVGADSGALRVIPGSHLSPFHDTLRQDLGMHMEKAGFDIPELPGHVCDSQPGDVVVFDMRLWHASWGSSTDRRMCSIEYIRFPRTPAERRVVREVARGVASDPNWRAYAQGGPARQACLNRWREMAGE